MRKILVLVFVVIANCAAAQDSLKILNNSRNEITQTGMKVLTSWGLANIGTGAAGWAASKGGQNRYFYQMTTIWGAVNTAVALRGYVTAKRETNEILTPAESLRKQHMMERIFLFNGTLDVIYIGAGFYMDSRGSNNNNAQLKGFGTAIALQGAFLLLFDATMYRSEHGNGNKLRHFLEKTPITFTGKTIGIQLNI